MAVAITATYEGSLHCSLEHGPSGARLDTDAPTDNAGRGAAFSPTDLVGAALLSCAITTMGIRAAKDGLPFLGAKGRVLKEMASAPPRRIGSLTVEITMPQATPPEARGKLEDIARKCPVALSLSSEIGLPMTFVYA